MNPYILCCKNHTTSWRERADFCCNGSREKEIEAEIFENSKKGRKRKNLTMPRN
jgi:hypothetical protein